MEYVITGEHLKKIDPNWKFEDWSYRHTFAAKMRYVERYLSKVPKEAKILDAGCGQGLLVKELHEKGHNIIGIDIEYSSDLVKKGDILETGFDDSSFDLIICLDVIEHLNFRQQEKLIGEFHRLLKPGGKVLWSIPNMAHLSSRIAFLLLGRLWRTANVHYHPGDRPISEYEDILKKHFTIDLKKGITPTYPPFYFLVHYYPRYFGWLYKIMNLFAYPNWCFNVILETRK